MLSVEEAFKLSLKGAKRLGTALEDVIIRKVVEKKRRLIEDFGK